MNDINNNQRNVIILRGVAGSGKSTFADLVAEPKVVCCADDYFVDSDGNYNWVAEDIFKAHSYCRKTFDDALANDSIKNIVIANTNCKERDYIYYEIRAKEKNIRVIYVVLEKRHDNENVHSCPEEVINRQQDFLKNSLKLK